MNWSWYWETFIYSLAVKMPNFWGPQIDKKVINSPTNVWFLWKLQSSLLISYHRRWWKFGWFLICRNMSTDFVCFWKSFHAFKEHTSFVWIYSQLQIHTMLYVATVQRLTFKTFMFVFINSISPQKLFCQVHNQYRSLMTFRNKIQAKTFTWPDMSYYAR